MNIHKGGVMFSRRQFIATMGLLPFAARAQGIDTARILIGFPPGGTTDVMGRKVADKPIAASSPEEVTGLITGAIQEAHMH